MRRSPQSTPREFARSIAAVAEAGLRDEEGGPGAQGDSSAGGHADRFGVRAGAVAVMAMQASHGLSFEHVFVLGLQSSRMPGARRRAMEPIPDALLHETLPPDTRAAHVDEMRRLLHVAMTRARSGLVLAYATRGDAGALQPPSPFAEEARAALGAEWEERGEVLFGPDETVHATYQALRDELLQSIPRTGSRLGELRLDTDLDVAHGAVRYLELLKLAALMNRRAGPRGRRRPAGHQRRDPPRRDARAARDPPDELARRPAPRRRARRPGARGRRRGPGRAVARAVPADAAATACS